MASQDANSQRITLPSSWQRRSGNGSGPTAGKGLLDIDRRLHGVSWQKRLLDVVISVGALVLTAPITVVAIILIKLTSRGSVFFAQERVGINRRLNDRRLMGNGGPPRERRNGDRRSRRQYGKSFTMYKFRTMKESAENGNPQFAELNDPRVTSVGRLLRRSRIDEIPQFVNVLTGDMSIVGPRPERAYFIDRIDGHLPEFRWRLRAKPGITGLAQVTLGYTNTAEGMRNKLGYDLEYIRQAGPATDLRILARTVRVVLTGKGAF